MLGLRFSDDPICTRARFKTLHRELGQGFESVEIDSSSGNPWGIKRTAHSVLTEELVDDEDHPTKEGPRTGARLLRRTIETPIGSQCFLFRIHKPDGLTIGFFLAGCASNAPNRKPAEIAPSTSEHPGDILELVTTVDRVLNDRQASPPPNNTYSHETAYGPEQLAAPRVYLETTEAFSALASTDCSGWVTFVTNTVSPLHEAVLQSQRELPEYNRTYGDGFELKEGQRPWPRAFVLTNYFRSNYLQATGFERVERYQDLRLGDLAAYSMGRYTNPSDADLLKPKDTGHTFVIVGSPSIVDPSTPGYNGNGTLARRAETVIAVPIMDSSSTPHFDPRLAQERARRVLATTPDPLPQGQSRRRRRGDRLVCTRQERPSFAAPTRSR